MLNGEKPPLQEGEVYCDVCKGYGDYREERLDFKCKTLICHKCHGAGKLDWVENICGKRDSIIPTIAMAVIKKIRTRPDGEMEYYYEVCNEVRRNGQIYYENCRPLRGGSSL